MLRAMKKLMLQLSQKHVSKIMLENNNFKNLKRTIFIMKLIQTKMLTIIKIFTAKTFYRLPEIKVQKTKKLIWVKYKI